MTKQKSNEDEIAQSIIQNEPGYDYNVEVHYNHYGTRGVVDLLKTSAKTTELIEIKSESAVRNSTGANEIIRQSKRHKKYFIKDNPEHDVDCKLYHLIFSLTKYNWSHVLANRDLYRSFRRSGDDFACGVHFRHPDCKAKVSIQGVEGFDSPSNYYEYIEDNLIDNPFDAAGFQPFVL